MTVYKNMSAFKNMLEKQKANTLFNENLNLNSVYLINRPL